MIIHVVTPHFVVGIVEVEPLGASAFAIACVVSCFPPPPLLYIHVRMHCSYMPVKSMGTLFSPSLILPASFPFLLCLPNALCVDRLRLLLIIVHFRPTWTIQYLQHVFSIVKLIYPIHELRKVVNVFRANSNMKRLMGPYVAKKGGQCYLLFPIFCFRLLLIELGHDSFKFSSFHYFTISRCLASHELCEDFLAKLLKTSNRPNAQTPEPSSSLTFEG